MRLDTLAKQCEEAFKKNPGLWMDEDVNCVFDFPEYGGLPEETHSVLSPDCVDCIQGYLNTLTEVEDFSKGDLLSYLKECKKSGWAIPT